MAALRHEVHYGGRVVRCFSERPAHIDAMFRDVAARNPDRDALVLGERARHLQDARRARSKRSPAIWRSAASRKATASRCCSAMASNSSSRCWRRRASAVIIVPMSTRQRAPETEFILTQCEAAGLIYQGDLAEHLPARDALPHLRECFVVGDGPGTSFAQLTTPCAAPRRRHRRGRCLLAALYLRHHRPPEGRDAHPSRHHPLADALRAGHGAARRRGLGARRAGLACHRAWSRSS